MKKTFHQWREEHPLTAMSMYVVPMAIMIGWLFSAIINETSRPKTPAEIAAAIEEEEVRQSGETWYDRWN